MFSIFGLYVFSNCKQYVCAGINTLIFISDGLDSSIFCRKKESTRPMSEKMHEEVADGESAFWLWCCNLKVLFTICTLKIMFPHKEEV